LRIVWYLSIIIALFSTGGGYCISTVIFPSMEIGMSEKIKVMVADDHPLIRVGIQIVLAESKDIEIVGEACNGAEVIAQVSRLSADILILDATMPGMSASEVVEAVKKIAPTLKIIMICTSEEEPFVRTLNHTNIHGHLLKEENDTGLVDVIQTVYGGGTSFRAHRIQTTLTSSRFYSPAKSWYGRLNRLYSTPR
jgi:DNA-binding NarL/FixJ family response regulator